MQITSAMVQGYLKNCKYMSTIIFNLSLIIDVWTHMIANL